LRCRTNNDNGAQETASLQYIILLKMAVTAETCIE